MTGQCEFDEGVVREVIEDGLESLEAASAALQRSSTNAEETPPVDEVFRALHSIKGNTGMICLTGISDFAHRIENALDGIREGRQAAGADELGMLLEGVDLLTGLLERVDCRLVTERIMPSHHAFLERLAARFPDPEEEQDEPREPTDSAAPRPEAANSDPAEAGPATSSGGSLRVNAASLDTTMKIAGDLFNVDERLKHLLHGATHGMAQAAVTDELREVTRDLDSAMTHLYEQLLDICKVPVAQLTRPLERIVRDSCRQQGKRIRLVVEGERLGLDKQLLETLRDPLVHLMRNAVDHGIEPPELRQAVGKPEEGLIEIHWHVGEENVVVTVADDGKGIDLDAVRAKAIRQRTLTAAQARSVGEQALVDLIFQPRFSTAREVTALSGRGVGLDVVASNVRRTGGSVRAHTRAGRGTTFVLELPKTGSPVCDGMVVRIAGHTYVFPIKAFHGFFSWSDITVRRLPGRQRVAALEEELLPILRLDGLDPSNPESENSTTMCAVIEDREGRRGVLPVDEVLGRQKTLVVGAEGCIERSPNIAGTFLLGDGAVGFAVRVERLLAGAGAARTAVEWPDAA